MTLHQISSFLTNYSNDEHAEKVKSQLRKGRKHNRIYSYNQKDEAEGFCPTFYTKALIYAGEPYYCPNGWRRCGLDLGLSHEEFSSKYQNWPVCYHGTSPASAFAIISNGFRAQNNSSCWIKEEDKAVYLTPSIVYAGHPRYAKISKFKGRYIQFVLQLRVKKGLFSKMPGTVENTFVCEDKKVDVNYKNKELEWVFVWNENRLIKARDGIVIYGIMVRIHETNPRFMSGNQWWQDSRQRLKWDQYEH